MSRKIVFLGGHGAPGFLYQPWFLAMKLNGFEHLMVPNSSLHTDRVTTFAQNFVESSAGLEDFDVIGVSYGGTAAFHGLHLQPNLKKRIRRLVTVCAPIFGVPFLSQLPEPFKFVMNQPMKEMVIDTDVMHGNRKAAEDLQGLEVHCLYHPRDFVTPIDYATLGDKSENYTLPEMSYVPGIVMHQAASINPGTFMKVLEILNK